MKRYSLLRAQIEHLKFLRKNFTLTIGASEFATSVPKEEAIWKRDSNLTAGVITFAHDCWFQNRVAPDLESKTEVPNARCRSCFTSPGLHEAM